MKAPWIEKYRPTKLEEVVGNKNMIEQFNKYIESPSEQMPHLLFVGSPGIGKTSCAKILANLVTDDTDIMYVNASEERGIDKSREISNFCSRVSFSDSNIKVVILDEFDNMTKDAQLSLKNTMEEFAEETRFVLTCNYRTKVEDAIESRCVVYTFSDTPKEAIAKRCLDILKEENIKAVNFVRDVKLIINQYYPDIRQIVGSLQRFSNQGVFKVDKNSLVEDCEDKLLSYINSGDWRSIQSELCGKATYESLYSMLFKNAKSISSDSEVDVMLCVGDGMKNDSNVVDRQMNFMCCILQIMRLIEVV